MKVDLENAEIIGAGNFAKIYKFFSKEHKSYLCARSVTINKEELEELEKEKEINRQLMKVNSPYILKIYGIQQTEDKILYITQYCEGGSLFQCLDAMPNNKLEPEHAIAMIVKIARGIQILHNNKITHRDLKPENILLVRKFKPGFQIPDIKIADFGLSTNSIIMKTLAGTKQYIAPEQAKYHNYTNAVDVWALGIILDEMLHGTPYFVGENNEEVFKRCTTEEFMVRDKGLPKQIQELLVGMLKKKAFERPTIGQVIHKLQTLLQLLKTSKVSTVTIKNIRSADKNSGFLCREHNNKVQYLKQNASYCSECILQEIVPVEDFVKTLPNEKDKLFKLTPSQKFQPKWNLETQLESIEQHSKLFKQLKPLFSSINYSTLPESESKSFQQQKPLRTQAKSQLQSKSHQIVKAIKTQLYNQLDSQLQSFLNCALE